MRIVDVCAFYTPSGGGVRTYVEAKLKAAPRLGHELVVIAPGDGEKVTRVGPGAVIATIPAPTLPVDRRYRYFDHEGRLHRALDAWRPDHVEASSPWSSATMVGRWQGAATRSLIMHSDPLAAYAYRWFGAFARTATIDRWFAWFWRHLRGLDGMFDLVVSANRQLADRLSSGGMTKSEAVAMGVERGIFSPSLRSRALRAEALNLLRLDSSGVLLVAIGRFSPEKRWDTVVRAVGAASRRLPVGLLLIGDGPRRTKLELQAATSGRVLVLPKIDDRSELARLLASADGLVHGCEGETFCMVASEARASGVPIIVPNRGAAHDQLVPGAGLPYRAGSECSLERAIIKFVARRPELQRAAAARSSAVRTMDEHFADLFMRYAELRRTTAPQADPAEIIPNTFGEAGALALVPVRTQQRSLLP